jgi:hypothetical protein
MCSNAKAAAAAPWRFACSCGACSFEVTGAPIGFVYCHCSDCRGHHEAILAQKCKAEGRGLPTQDEVRAAVPAVSHIAHWCDVGLEVTKGLEDNGDGGAALAWRYQDPKAAHNKRFYCQRCATPLFYHAQEASICGVNWATGVDPELIPASLKQKGWKEWCLVEPDALIDAVNSKRVLFRRRRPMHMLLHERRDDLPFEAIEKASKKSVVAGRWNVWLTKATWAYSWFATKAILGFVKGRGKPFNVRQARGDERRPG